MKGFTEEFEARVRESNFNVYNVVQIKDGVVEQRRITPVANCINSYSVAKTFVVTAVGFLFDEGKLTLDEKVTQILAEYLPKDYDKRYDSLTVDEAMRHYMGLPRGYLDIDVYSPETFGKDFLAKVFTTPPTEGLGKEYVYTDAAYYVLARVVEKVSGEALEDFLRVRLFEPLGFREVAWSKCPMGHALGATGLYITTADMAKLGLLYLQKGVYEGKQIISEKWAELAVENEYELRSRFGGRGYGKSGMYNQMLLVIPKQNRVVAWHAFDRGDLAELREWVVSYGE